MNTVYKFKIAALVTALTVGIGSTWAADATTFSISGDLLRISQHQTEYGPTMVLTENYTGALQTRAGRPGVVAFDLTHVFPLKQDDYVAGKWILPDGQGSDGTTATWCGKSIYAANLWVLQGDGPVDRGGRLYVKLPSISTGMPCTLEVKPYLYAQPHIEPTVPIEVALFDPSDPMNVAIKVATSPYASQSDIDTWAQPTVDASAIQPLAQVTVKESSVSGIMTGDNRTLNLTCRFQPPRSILDMEQTLYVAAILPENSGFFFMDGNGGWHSHTGQGDWQTYTTETMHSAPYDIVVAQNLDVTSLPNDTVIYIGWGSNSSEVDNKGQYSYCGAIQGN